MTGRARPDIHKRCVAAGTRPAGTHSGVLTVPHSYNFSDIDNESPNALKFLNKLSFTICSTRKVSPCDTACCYNPGSEPSVPASAD